MSGASSLSLQPFDTELAAAHAGGEHWADDPIQIVGRFTRAGLARRARWVVEGSGEQPSRYRIVVVTDGIPRDSVRGARFGVTIERASGGGWRIADASESWRCWRRRAGGVGAAPCP